jgi:hypothetical protein
LVPLLLDTMSWHYEYAGLRVLSEIEIPEWSVFARENESQQADVFIVLNAARDASVLAKDAYITRDECRFFIHAVGEYRIRAACEIVVTPLPNTGERELRLFLLGAAWGALCYQRGILLLHASVVRAGTRTFAFCGPSGAGKSSIAAALVARGGTLVSDDLSCVDFSTAKIASLYPAAPRLKLWNDALAQLNTSARGLERDFFRAEKFHVPLPAHAELAPVKLDALYILNWGTLQLERLRGVAALRRLAQDATYRGDLVERMGIHKEHWERMAELARRVNVYALQRARTWEHMNVALALMSQPHDGD